MIKHVREMPVLPSVGIPCHYEHQPWTPWELEWLGVKPDEEIVRLTRHPLSSNLLFGISQIDVDLPWHRRSIGETTRRETWP